MFVPHLEVTPRKEIEEFAVEPQFLEVGKADEFLGSDDGRGGFHFTTIPFLVCFYETFALVCKDDLERLEDDADIEQGRFVLEVVEVVLKLFS